MDADLFLKVVTNPDEWVDKARALRSSAEVLYDSAEGIFNRIEIEEISAREKALARAYIMTSQLLYGLAVEVALKASLVRHRPDDVSLGIEADGRGEAQRASLQFKRVKDGHDLVELAKASGVFSKQGPPAAHPSLEAVLRLLSERVRWSGRYPTPMKSGDDHEWKKRTPMILFSTGFREAIDPLLDTCLSQGSED